MAGAFMMALVLLVTVGITLYLVGTMVRSIRNERRTNARLWKNFEPDRDPWSIFPSSKRLSSWRLRGSGAPDLLAAPARRTAVALRLP